MYVQYMMYNEGGMPLYSMETETPTVEDIQLLKKTVASEASQVQTLHRIFTDTQDVHQHASLEHGCQTHFLKFSVGYLVLFYMLFWI